MLNWQKIITQLRTMISYGIFGGIGAISDVCVFKFLCVLGVYYLLANIIGYVLGTCISFILNRHFTFKLNDKILRRVILFYVAALLGLATSMLFLYLFVEVGGISPFSAKLATLILVFIVQYTFNRLVTFRAARELQILV